MSFKVIYLDSAPLMLLTHNRRVVAAEECRQWLNDRVLSGQRVIVPEVADYEVRRELIRTSATARLARLDGVALKPGVTFQPITTPTMRLAAQLWADLRRTGRPTADPHALDADVILCAGLLVAEAADPSTAVAATSNAQHLGRLVNCDDWRTII